MLEKKFIVTLALCVSLSGCNKHSGFCNYVEVQNEKDFNGEWLKHSSAIQQKTMKVDECSSNDKKFDDGNDKKGKIRWAECFEGPDCNEAGMF